MSVNLQKNSRVNLSKVSAESGVANLTRVWVGLGWDVNSSGFGHNYDLDAWALAGTRNNTGGRSDICYFGQKSILSKAIHHLGDNLTGAGSGDDETIDIKLEEIPMNIDIVFIGVTIYDAARRHQHFSDVDNAFIRIYTKDAHGSQVEICKYADQFKGNLGDEYTMLFGILTRETNGWVFRAVGEGLDVSDIPGVRNIQNILLEKEKKNMAVSLSKGGKVSLAKAAADAGVTTLKNIGVGLGWDVKRYDGGSDFDLDASAFLQNASKKVRTDSDFIFYNNKTANGIVHTGDNRTGDGDGDDELIKITLDSIDADVEHISFTVTIHEAAERGQNFGMVENAYIRVFDLDTNTELIRYDLSEDYSIETALVVGELYKNNGEWKFSAIGSGYQDGLAGLCRQFGVDIG